MSSALPGNGETQATAVASHERDGSQAANALQNGGYESERRAQRRQRHELEKEEAKQWEIMKSLSEISAEVELLTQEVAKIRHSILMPAEQPRELTAADRQVLAENHKKRLSEIVLKQCAQALRHVQSHKWAFPFNEPVDLERYPDYLKAVSEPMDFGTIKAKIDAGTYVQPGQFNADMRLVFGNAHKYNAPGSDVHHMASTLLERYDEKWNLFVVPKVIEEELNCKVDEDNMRKKLAEAAQREAGQALEAEGNRLQQVFSALQERIQDAKSLAAAACKPMPLPEKARLVQDMQKLSPDHFDWATSIVLGRYPGAVQGAGEELGLDISQVDALTLRQLQHYVRSCFAAGDGPVSWPGCLVGSGVSAFQAPGKRQKVAAAQEANAKGGTPLGLQLLDTPRPAGLPHLKVPTPGTMGSAKATMESSTAAPIPAALAQAQKTLQGLSHAVPTEVSMQDGFKVPLPRRPGSLPVTPRAASSPAAAGAPVGQDQAGATTPALNPSAGADASAGAASGSTSRLANVTVGAWNGAPCTEDDPLRAASSGGAEVYVTAAAEPSAQGQETSAKQKGAVMETEGSVAGPSSEQLQDGDPKEEQEAVPMEAG